MFHMLRQLGVGSGVSAGRFAAKATSPMWRGPVGLPSPPSVKRSAQVLPTAEGEMLVCNTNGCMRLSRALGWRVQEAAEVFSIL